MSGPPAFTLQGTALPNDAVHLLDELCEHYVEHAEVSRTADLAILTSRFGTAQIRLEDRRLLIELACPSQAALQLTQTSLAEHMFYFAGADALDLRWSEPASRTALPNLQMATVVGAENVTPHMRRVRFSCADVAPFIGGDMHVRLLFPPKGRAPVWPGHREDGRIAWPDGEDALLVRVYTIRVVDPLLREVWIDFLQHPAPGVRTPGADFARDAQAGDVVALLGPGAGHVPTAKSMLLIGDESALPAIARIAAEVAPGTAMRAIIEVADAQEEQPLPSAGSLEVLWLHRSGVRSGSSGVLASEAFKAIDNAPPGTFVWVACEKEDVRIIRSRLKQRQHSRSAMYVAWYWERQ